MNPSDPVQGASPQMPLPQPTAGSAAVPDAPVAAAPTPTPSQAASQQIPEAAHVVQTPGGAQDSDTIEHEWVLKTKQIIMATRNDPYEQNRQIAALKADYMQKRYGKTIKLSE